MPNNLCLCGSKKAFVKCCEPLLKGDDKAKTVKQLVRSRYTAYALGNNREYLLKTWHPATARTISITDLSIPNHQWLGLEIITSQQKGDLGKVEFKATFKEGDGAEQIHHEKSIFHRIKGQWLYIEGEIVEET